MIIIYSDGGKRRERGVWAYVVVAAPLSSIRDDYNGHVSGRIIAYGHGEISNLYSSAEAELIAASRGIHRVISSLPKAHIHVVSDSTYVTHGLKYPFRMAKNNERYAPLWNALVPICAFNEITTHHVKGHTKQTFNAFADWICNEVLDRNTETLQHHINLFNSSRPWRRALIKRHR